MASFDTLNAEGNELFLEADFGAMEQVGFVAGRFNVQVGKVFVRFQIGQ